MSTRAGGIGQIDSGLGGGVARKPISKLGDQFAEQREQEKLERAASTRILITADQRKKFQEAFGALLNSIQKGRSVWQIARNAFRLPCLNPSFSL